MTLAAADAVIAAESRAGRGRLQFIKEKLPMRRQFLATLGALALGSHIGFASAAPWPTQTVRIIVPSAPGSPWDPLSRLLAERLGQRFGQTFIVENKSGATGTLGMDQVAKATDGHTLGVIFMPHVLTPSLFKKMPYDILHDVVPVAQTQWSYNVLVVNPSLPAKSMKELVELARSKPGKLTIASGGNGTPAHVMAEHFKQVSGTYMVHIPYRGPVFALRDLIGGQTDLMFAAAAPAIAHAQAGRLRAIAVTSPKRLAALPEVPTFGEVGFPKFDVRDWAGIVASPSVPAEMVPVLSAEIAKVLAEPAVAEQFVKMGIELHSSSPQALGELMRSETAKWREVIRTANIHLE